MAMIKSFKCSNGAEIFVHDDAYAGISEEEMLRRHNEILEFAKKIVIDSEIRRVREAGSAEEASDE